MLSQGIKSSWIKALFVLVVLLSTAPVSLAQGPTPRTLDNETVDGILSNDRWRFGRRDLTSRRSRPSSQNSGESTSNRSNRSTRTTEGGEYYWDDENRTKEKKPQDLNGDDVRDRPDQMDDWEPRERDSSPPNLDFSPPSGSTGGGAGFMAFLKWALIILGVGLLAFMVYKSIGTGAFKGKQEKVKEESDYVDFEEDIHEIEFVDEIELAVRDGNYRRAIRLMFLNSLKDLSDLNLIRWKLNKTNYDYISELHGNSHQRVFMDLTLVYEYCWYGEFDISESYYREVAKEFKSFNRGLYE